MGPLDAPTEELHALERGRAFADLSSFRKVRVSGTDARAWLHDLVTCDVATIAPGRSRRSLLLSPTGRILADFAVAQDAEGLLLLQAPEQPEPIGSLLTRYVLSSDVTLRDAASERSLFTVPGADTEEIGRPDDAFMLAPSVLGRGWDLLTTQGADPRLIQDALARDGFTPVSADSLEVWRIRHGRPRMGPDFGTDSLPAEAGLEDTIDLAKGCFLGQEAVAKVRNLGHAPRVLRHVLMREAVGAGVAVMAGEETAGILTSAAVAEPSGTVGIARVRWEFALADLTTPGGSPMVAVGSMD